MGKCLIWGTLCEDAGSSEEFLFLDSPRAGGKYKLFGTAQRQVTELTPAEKKAVTSWIVSQHRAGIAVPQIDGNNIEDVKRQPPLNFSERIDRVLELLGNRTKIGGVVAVDVASAQSRQTLDDLLAFTESADAEEAQSMLKMLDGDIGLVGRSQETLFYLKPKGWFRLDELHRKEVKSSQAFVAMWFNKATQEPYTNGLYKAIYDSGYEARRVDQQHHHLNKVDDEIIAEIRRSRFLVADFTCEPGNVRGGVYFEAGYANGLGIPIIWTCKNTSMGDLHFDTRQYPHIEWSDSTDLYTKLKARIGALIGDGPKRRS
jgi:hypothetical protein